MDQSRFFQAATALGNKFKEARRLRALNKPDEALKIFRDILQEFRDDESGLIKGLIEQEIASTITERASKLHDQGKFREACSASVDDLERQGGELNEEGKLALKDNAALNLLEMGDYSRSFEMLKEVAQRRLQLFGPNECNTLATQSNLARVLDKLGKYEDSLKLYKDVLNRMNHDHPLALTTHMNMAVLMLKLRAFRDALEQFQLVLEKRIRISGPDHPDTLMVQNNLAKALFELKRFPEALKVFTDVYNKRKETLGLDHPHTQTSQAYLGRIMAAQGDHLGALKKYNLVAEKYKALLGESHQDTQNILLAIEMLKRRVGPRKFADLQTLCAKSIELDKLHDLISSGDKNGVEDLLADGLVDITQVTAQKGNTPLHMAVNKNNTDIVESLLVYAEKKLTPNEMIKFLDAKTTSAVGNTAMHIAASNGSLKSMKALLRYGATYSVKNKKGKTPIYQTNDPKIESFLGLIDEMFEAAKRGDPGVIGKLKALNKDEQLAVTNARDDRGNSLHQVSKIKSLSVEFSKLSV